MRMMPEIRIHA